MALKFISHFHISGVKFQYLWAREPYFLSLPFLAFCRAIGLTKLHRRGHFGWPEHNFRGKPVALAWRLLQFFDAWWFSFMKVRLLMLLGYTVVCDRFLHDVLVDLMVDTGDHTIYKRRLGRLFMALVPKSALVFLLDVPEKIAFQRKHDIPHMGYLGVRRRLYQRLAEVYKMFILGGNQTFGQDT
jgi:dTMP kinase